MGQGQEMRNRVYDLGVMGVEDSRVLLDAQGRRCVGRTGIPKRVDCGKWMRGYFVAS